MAEQSKQLFEIPKLVFALNTEGEMEAVTSIGDYRFRKSRGRWYWYYSGIVDRIDACVYSQERVLSLANAHHQKTVASGLTRREDAEKTLAAIALVGETGILPDGDHVGIPEMLWIDDLVADLVSVDVPDDSETKGEQL